MKCAKPSLRFNLWLTVILMLLPACVLAEQYQVIRVVDGDTLVVSRGSAKLTIRLVGIDAPEASRKKHEPGQPFSQQSTKYLAKLVLNRTVDVKSYRSDRYGRLLGEVFVNGKNVNLEMIKAGFAEVYRGKPSPGQDREPYWKAEEEARAAANRGMWAQGDKYVSPREWRKMHQN